MHIRRSLAVPLLAAVSLSLAASSGWARYAATYDYRAEHSGMAAPALCMAGHNVGKIELMVVNNGTFGDGYTPSNNDCFTGEIIQSCAYPKDSPSRYLFVGAVWIGAVVGRDTLVSQAADGWTGGQELFPDDIVGLQYRSITDPSKPDVYEGAISEEDYLAVYYDTCINCSGVSTDKVDNRPHRPIGLKVTQNSYAWSYSYAEDFVLFDFSVQNINTRRLNDVYMGIYVDADVHARINTEGYDDDVCGFIRSMPASYAPAQCPFNDTVNIAWIADNDGDLTQTTSLQVPNVTATRIVRTPSESLKVSFNWWISNGDARRDFGPQGRKTYRDLGTGGQGTPEGDRNKYWFLSNGEFDYDQVFTRQILPLDTQWQYPPQQVAPDLSDGYDTRYLLSFGPFDIEPGQSLPISLAYVGGMNLHTDETNLGNLQDNYNPQQYYANLDFTDLGLNAAWASWIYDNPGVDSDSNGYAGDFHVCNFDSIPNPEGGWIITRSDTTWYRGDGVPDFRGASPPPAPEHWVIPEVGKITVRWNGVRSEETRDAFSRQFDFEGYRVYYGRDYRASSYTLGQSYDREDFNKFIFDPTAGTSGDWVLLDIPFTLDSLRALYAPPGEETTWNPLVYSRVNPYRLGDSAFYFEPQDYNRSRFGNEDQPLTEIVKMFPHAAFPSSLDVDSVDSPDEVYEENGKKYLKYFMYEYTIDNLLPTVEYYVNVTAFDFGSPQSGLKSLETQVTFNPSITYALESNTALAGKDLNVYVYPNPYRIDGKYLEEGFEGRERDAGVGTAERDRLRRVHFANLPPKCTIRIFSLDGDLVDEVIHDVDANDPEANHDTWDLITRNTQLIVSGIYYWTVEDDKGNTQIGKLVVVM